MENKYYVPDITEFRVGFEYEYKNRYVKDAEYEKYVVAYPNEDFIRKNIIRDKCKNIRVKYLDKYDIESFGFEFNKTFQNFIIVTDSNDTIFLNMYSDYNVLIGKDYGMGCKESILFKGVIKNKSELQQVLKMIGVIE